MANLKASIDIGSGISASDDFQAYTANAYLQTQGYWVHCYGIHDVKDTSGDKRITASSALLKCTKYNRPFTANHKSKITIDVIAAGKYVGVAARCSGADGTASFYTWHTDSADASYLNVVVNGTETNIAHGSVLAAGDTMELVVVGSSIKCYKNGTLDTSMENATSPATGTGGSYNDTRLTTGVPGISGYGSSGSYIDLFEAYDMPVGNLSISGTLRNAPPRASSNGVATIGALIGAKGQVVAAANGATTAGALLRAYGRIVAVVNGLTTNSGIVRAKGRLFTQSDGAAIIAGDIFDSTPPVVQAAKSNGLASASALLMAIGRLIGESLGVASVAAVIKAYGLQTGFSNGIALISGSLKGRGQASGVTLGSSVAEGDIYDTSIGIAIYYVSESTGSDNNPGIINLPWKTISKVNEEWAAGTFAPGDTIKFKCGDVFYGTLTPASSGSAENPILISSYGTGAKPILTGFTTLSGWTYVGNNIYSKGVSCESIPNIVTVNGVNTGMGRYPKIGNYSTFESSSGYASITDNQLSSIPNLTGAEVVLRTEDWIVHRGAITNHSGNTLNYTNNDSRYAPTETGYFIQKHLSTLTEVNDWFYDGATVYIYGNPAAKTVQVATSSHVVLASGYDNIIFDGVALMGGNTSIVDLTSVEYLKFQNCVIQFGGNTGVRVNAGTSNYITITYSTIDSCNNIGIDLGGSIDNNPIADNTIISHNTISNIGTILGMGGNNVSYTGITTNSPNTLIEYNIIRNTGYNGVSFWRNADYTIIRYNLVDTFCFNLEDGGGIYTWTNDGDPSHATCQVLNNIVINGIGANTFNTAEWGEVYGIYMDNNTQHVIISNNGTAYIKKAGIYFNNSLNITTNNNNCLGSVSSTAVIDFHNYGQMTGMVLTGNRFVGVRDPDSSPWPNISNYVTTGSSIGSPWSNRDYNYYVLPNFASTKPYMFYQLSSGYYPVTLAQWKSASGVDTHSLGTQLSSPLASANDVHFVYNASTANKNFSLSAAMVDVTNSSYSGVITLLPYASLILLGAGTITEITGGNSVIEGTTNGIATPASRLYAKGKLVGATEGSTTASLIPSFYQRLTSSVSGIVITEAVLTGRAKRRGAANSGALVSATITAIGKLAVVYSGIALATGYLFSKTNLSSYLASNSEVYAALRGRGRLTGSSSCATAALCAIRAKGRMRAVITGQASTSLVRRARGKLVAVVNGITTASLAIKAKGRIIGAATGSSAVNAPRLGKGDMAARSICVSSVSASAKGRAHPLCSTSGYTTTSARLRPKGILISLIAGTATAGGTIGGASDLRGTVVTSSALHAILKGHSALSALSAGCTVNSGIARHHISHENEPITGCLEMLLFSCEMIVVMSADIYVVGPSASLNESEITGELS
jgi:hypothetical protein